jgi:hypothetical protein
MHTDVSNNIDFYTKGLEPLIFPQFHTNSIQNIEIW